MNPRATPPVCRLMSYDAYRYELKLKDKEARRRGVDRRRQDVIKTLRLSARISDNDLKTKAVQATKLIALGHGVRARIEFKKNDGVAPTAAMRHAAGEILFKGARVVIVAHF